MKIEPIAHNAATIILDDGSEFEIRESDNGMEINTHSDPERKIFEVFELSDKFIGWKLLHKDNWIRIKMKES
jgi:hypothetical protein